VKAVVTKKSKPEETTVGQSSPIALNTVALNTVDPLLAGRIVEIADKDGPRAAYAALSHRLSSLQAEGRQIPPHLKTLKDRLVAECCALSQGR
jgi:hypothetical protein